MTHSGNIPRNTIELLEHAYSIRGIASSRVITGRPFLNNETQSAISK